MSIYEQKSAKAERWADKPKKQYDSTDKSTETARVNLVIPKSVYTHIIAHIVPEEIIARGKNYTLAQYLRDTVTQAVQADIERRNSKSSQE